MGNDGSDGEFDGVVVLVAQVPLAHSHRELAREEALLVLVLGAVRRRNDMPVQNLNIFEHGKHVGIHERTVLNRRRSCHRLVDLSVMRAPPHQNSRRPPPCR